MSASTKLLALLATMGRINPTIFATVSPRKGAADAPRDLHIDPLDEPVLRACALKTPELTAGFTAVQLLTAAAVAAQATGSRAETVLAEGIEEWCRTSVRSPIPWPSKVPMPEWAVHAQAEPWRERDMFYSAAAALAGVATRLDEEPTRAVVQHLSEVLLHRAELGTAA